MYQEGLASAAQSSGEVEGKNGIRQRSAVMLAASISAPEQINISVVPTPPPEQMHS